MYDRKQLCANDRGITLRLIMILRKPALIDDADTPFRPRRKVVVSWKTDIQRDIKSIGVIPPNSSTPFFIPFSRLLLSLFILFRLFLFTVLIERVVYFCGRNEYVVFQISVSVPFFRLLDNTSGRTRRDLPKKTHPSSCLHSQPIKSYQITLFEDWPVFCIKQGVSCAGI